MYLVYLKMGSMSEWIAFGPFWSQAVKRSSSRLAFPCMLHSVEGALAHTLKKETMIGMQIQVLAPTLADSVTLSNSLHLSQASISSFDE